METLQQLLIDWGYGGLFISAFVAGSILPFSSEAVLLVLLRLGLDPWGCLLAASAGNWMGGVTCYWVGSMGRMEWIERLGISAEKLQRARRFLAGRGALMAFFGFLPVLGAAILVALGLMKANRWIAYPSMLAGKVLRYALILWSFRGITSLF